MTDREKAIVMTYTGIAMLTGEKIDEFYMYLAELYGRPVYTHEIVTLDIQEKAKPDFVELCRTELPSAEPEIIRCHECAKRRTLDCPMGITVFDAPPSDGYCYKAERRNDG